MSSLPAESGAHGASASSDLPLEFAVTYRLGEYLAFLRARVSAELATIAPGSRARWQRAQDGMVWFLVSVFGTVAFLYKTWRLGTCHFSIDANRITRSSRNGTLNVPWDEIVAVYRYPAGYLLAKNTGAVPIPVRVLADAQRRALDALIDGRPAAGNPA